MNRVLVNGLVLAIAATLSVVAGACDRGSDAPSDKPKAKAAKSGEFVPGAPQAKDAAKPKTTAEFKGTGELLPRPAELEGFKLSTGPEYYTKDNLFEVIDGGADSYIGYGTTDMAKAVYTPTGEFKEEVNVEIYHFATKYGPLGKFSEERSACKAGGKHGANWCLRQSDLIFWKGAYMVKVQTFDDSAAADKAVLTIAEGVDAKIKGGADLPSFLGKLPKTGRLSGTAGWRNRSQFGFDGLKDLFIQKYRPAGDAYKDEDAQVTLFGAPQKTADAAKALFAKLRETVDANEEAKSKGGAKELVGVGEKAFLYSDQYGIHTFVLKGATVAGGRDFKDADTAKALTTELATKL